MQRLEIFARVRVVTDRFLKQGVARGAVGYIIEDYVTEYEVEFSRPDGTTYAQLVARSEDLETVEHNEGSERMLPAEEKNG